MFKMYVNCVLQFQKVTFFYPSCVLGTAQRQFCWECLRTSYTIFRKCKLQIYTALNSKTVYTNDSWYRIQLRGIHTPSKLRQAFVEPQNVSYSISCCLYCILTHLLSNIRAISSSSDSILTILDVRHFDFDLWNFPAIWLCARDPRVGTRTRILF